MFSWCRDDDFYNPDPSLESHFAKFRYPILKFKTIDPRSYLRYIEITANRENNLVVTLDPSFLLGDKFQKILKESFDSYRIFLANHADTTKFIEFLKKLKIPDAVITDIKNISEHYFWGLEPVEHLVPLEQTNSPYDEIKNIYNPKIKFPVHHRTPIDVPLLQNALVKGLNPNVVSEWGFLILAKAVKEDSLAATKLLLVYGGNPLIRELSCLFRNKFRKTFVKSSPFELALEKKSPLLGLFNSLFTLAPEKPPTLTIDHSSMISKDNGIETQLKFSNNKTIKTSIRRSKEFKQEDKRALVPIFLSEFNSTDIDVRAQDYFLESLEGNETFIEILYNKEEKIIGFFCYEVGHLEKTNQYIVHSLHGLIDKDHRGLNILSLFSCRFKFGLQLLVPNMLVGLFFCSISFNSYRPLIPYFLHTPRHQPDGFAENLREILTAFFKDDFVLRHDNPPFPCYLKDFMQVPEDKSKGSSIYKEFFEETILGGTIKSGKTSVPVVVYSTMHTYLLLLDMFANMGIHFGEHVRLFATLARKTLFPHYPINKTPSKLIFASNQTFWNPEKKPATDVKLPAQLLCGL